MNVPKGFKPSPEEEEERRKKELEKESQKKKQKALEEKRKKDDGESSGKSALALKDLVIKEIGKLVETLEEETKPTNVDNFDPPVNNYHLTLKNIKQILWAGYKDKEKDAWMDVYLFEYNEEAKIEEDFVGLKYKLKELSKDNKEGENLRMLVQDKYLVLIHAYTRELDKAAEKIFNGYKAEFGMQEIDVVCVRK